MSKDECTASPATPDNAALAETGSTGNDRARNIVQGMGSLTVQNLGTSLLGFIFLATLLRAQFLPPVQYGIYSAVLVSVNIASAFAGFGLGLSATRYVAFLRKDSEEASWAAARKILLLSLLLTAVVTSFYIAISPSLSLYFTRSPSWTWAFFLGAAWLFSTSIASTFQGILQGLKKYSQLAKILFVTRLVMVAFTIATLLIFHNVGFAIGAWAIFNVLIIIWIFGIIGSKIFRASDTVGYSGILRYSAPLGGAAVIAIFATSSDAVVVGGSLTTISLGVYTAATTIASVLSIVILTPLTTALLPEVSSSRSDGDISYGLRLSLRFATLAILPASLFVAAVPVQLLGLFSSGGVYIAGSFTLEMIALFYVFLATQSILLVLLQAVGKTVQVIIVGLITAATDIGVAVLLVSHFGLAGAVASKIAVSLDGLIVAIYFSKNYLKTLDRVGFYLKGAFAAGVPFAVVLALTYFVSSRVITLLLYAIVYSLIFLVCARMVKLVSDDDRAFLLHILPGPLKRLVRLI